MVTGTDASGADWTGFSHPDAQPWADQVARDLRGADPHVQLFHRRLDGLETAPVYTRLISPHVRSEPGTTPFIRGRFPHGRWQSWQVVDASDPARAHQQAQEELAGGAHGLLIPVVADLKRSASPGLRGVRCGRAADLHTVLKGLPLVRTWLSLVPGLDFAAVGAALIQSLQTLGVADRDVRGVVGADPVAVLAQRGSLPCGAGTLSTLADLALWCGQRLPGLRVAVADSRPWHEAGLTDVDELALVLSTAVTYLRAIEAAGAPLPMAFSQISFRLCTDTDLFQGVARVRALRGLWGHVAQVCGMDGDPQGGAYVHLLPGRRGMTRCDPWINLLRNTAVAFAGAVGGADAVTTFPLDSELTGGGQRASSARSRRLARNTHTILAAEAHLDRVADPAGGSYFIERRTTQLMEAAWRRFQQLEADGGVLEGLTSGRLQAAADQAWVQRAAQVARRTRRVVGVSVFPNLDEPMLADAAPARVEASLVPTTELDPKDLVEAGQGAQTTSLLGVLSDCGDALPLSVITELLTIEGPVTAARPLPQRRLSEPFEVLRKRSDDWLQRWGRRPAVFLVLLGPASETTARAVFARDLLAAGGLASLELELELELDPTASDATNDEAVAVVVDQARAASPSATVAVLCGPDARLLSQGPQVTAALRAAGLQQLWLVSPPHSAPGMVDDSAGFNSNFIYEGCDVLACLDQIWAEVEA